MTGALPPPPDRTTDGVVRADVVIVGAGAAGLYAAVQLPPGLEVVVVDKGLPGGDSGSSPWAQAGLAAPLGPGDRPSLHAEDTLRASDGLCDPGAVGVLTREIGEHVGNLLALGARFDRVPGHGDAQDLEHLALAREGGQQVARSVKRADATGAELIRVLRTAAARRVRRLAGIAVTLQRDHDGRVVGVWVLSGDGIVAVEARAVLLATGGCGGLFSATTNPDGATGDGVSLAAAAGAAVRDLEFVQFHPTGLAVAGSWRFLLTEALRGAGATLHDADGHRFMVDRHPDAELAPRHVVASAILDLPGARALLDATHLDEVTFREEFPTVLEGARQHGFDLAHERVPVTPAAHYQVGGVRTDLWGRTSLGGLYAAGEVASTGVHGANRMAGNSLAEALVFGARAATAMADELAPAPTQLVSPPSFGPPPEDLAGQRAAVRDLLLHGIGPVRDGPGLSRLLDDLGQVRAALGPPAPRQASVEFDHLLRTARLIAQSALLRTESRGGHRRTDHPERDPAWNDTHLELISTH